jgi:hypothetical protein
MSDESTWVTDRGNPVRAVYLLTGLALALAPAGLGVLVIGVFQDRASSVWTGVVLLSLAAVAGAGAQLLNVFRARLHEQDLSRRASRHLSNAVANSRRDTTAELITFNRIEMGRYHGIVRAQAASSFWAAVAAAVVGLVVLTGCLAGC